MTIKFAARGVSAQFRTPSELVTTDGVCLKPTYGGEVFVGSSTGVQLATAYDADTGGCTVDGTTYADTAALNAAGLYVLSDAVTAWDVSGSAVAKSGVGVADVYKSDSTVVTCYFKNARMNIAGSSAYVLRTSVGGAYLTVESANTKTWNIIAMYDGDTEIQIPTGVSIYAFADNDIDLKTPTGMTWIYLTHIVVSYS